MSWTPERIKLLKKAWQQGKSASAIARDLGVSKNAVIGKMHRLNLSEKVKKVVREVEVKKDAYVLPKNGVQLLDLKTNSCRWPMGEPTDPDFHFCGHEVLSGKPYCAKHCAIAYTNIKEAKESKNTKTKEEQGFSPDMDVEELVEVDFPQEEQNKVKSEDVVELHVSTKRKSKNKGNVFEKDMISTKNKIEEKGENISLSKKENTRKTKDKESIEKLPKTERKKIKKEENSEEGKNEISSKKTVRKTLTIKRKEEARNFRASFTV